MTILPILGLLFVMLNIAWGIFAKAVLQHAVREGVRYAVTSRTLPGLGHKDSIRTVVQRNALFLLKSEAGWNTIKVNFCTPETCTDVSNTAGGNAGGNLVRVAVENYTHANLMPTIRMVGLQGDLKSLSLSASAWDRMEASPGSGPPAL